MNWDSFYLICFVVGFALAAIAFVSGAVHLPHLHLPAGVQGHAGHAAVPGHSHAGGGSGQAVSPFNFGTLMAFLAWFGGMGYLLTTRGNLGRAAVLGLASASGFVGAAIVFTFLTRVLLKHERPLDAADFEMVGVLGRVTVTIRAGGTGEIVYSQAGTRRSAGARSDSGHPITRGAEVVVTGYDRGIAYVRPWEELAGIAVSPARPVPDGAREESIRLERGEAQ